MKRCMYVFFWIGMMFSCANQTVLLEQVAVDAPFEMPNIEIPNFSNAPRYSIVDFGAERDDVDATSQAIEAAIAKAHANKGGVVVIPTGEWLTGKVHVKELCQLAPGRRRSAALFRRSSTLFACGAYNLGRFGVLQLLSAHLCV